MIDGSRWGRRPKIRVSTFQSLAAGALVLMVAACAPTKVRSVSSYRGDESLPRPDRVLVYDFAISPEQVSLNWGSSRASAGT